ncbi:hypothetical protein [uncultured Clostridium sp.]|uniref:hypothetical protein n=1 Tax=uncultured Clostridium sp. TaxID=59620 RepID=UPI00260A83D5|nr:hypothetical protein [uncultured Clostridium sp.]
MSIKDSNVAIEELLATQVIRRGRLLSGTDSSVARIVIEKMCINCCGGRWEFGTYFFLDDGINVYLKFDDISTGEQVLEKFNFSKSEVEDFVFKYIGNENIKLEEVVEVKEEIKKVEKKISRKSKDNNLVQMSLF